MENIKWITFLITSITGENGEKNLYRALESYGYFR